MNNKIIDYLIKAGFKPSNIGFAYTREAVKIIINNNFSIKPVFKKIYTPVANMFNTTISKVERAIRHAKEISTSPLRQFPNADFLVRIAIEISK